MVGLRNVRRDVNRRIFSNKRFSPRNVLVCVAFLVKIGDMSSLIAFLGHLNG